jgi:hypothetical protein
MLFWEAWSNDKSSFSFNTGLCVPRADFCRVLNYLLKKMTFSSEDRDDMITYILPQLDEADPDKSNKNVIFRFLTLVEYAKIAQLSVRPIPDQIIRAFLLYGFGDDAGQLSTMDELEHEVEKVFTVTSNHELSGLIVHEWGSMFVQ